MALSAQHLRASGSRLSQSRQQLVANIARLHSPHCTTAGTTTAPAAGTGRVARTSTVAKAGADPLPDISLGSAAATAAGMDFDITSKASTVFVPSNVSALCSGWWEIYLFLGPVGL